MADAPSKDSWKRTGVVFAATTRSCVPLTESKPSVKSPCVSNGIAVHALEVDVLPGRPGRRSLGVHARYRLCGRDRRRSHRIAVERNRAPEDGPFTMNFAPPGAEVWGYSKAFGAYGISGSTSISRGWGEAVARS